MTWIITALAATLTAALLYMAVCDVIEARSYGERVNWAFLALVCIPLTVMLIVLILSTLNAMGRL